MHCRSLPSYRQRFYFEAGLDAHSNRFLERLHCRWLLQRLQTHVKSVHTWPLVKAPPKGPLVGLAKPLLARCCRTCGRQSYSLGLDATWRPCAPRLSPPTRLHPVPRACPPRQPRARPRRKDRVHAWCDQLRNNTKRETSLLHQRNVLPRASVGQPTRVATSVREAIL